ncbi:transcriptional regulator, AlpA family [Nonlabens sp. Hel1_33_55]|uniref:helix-turn-helix domain-containing protein n=1 Tax=Nonlabens sp. Hel1_33_55 TaxID=1336802 RepID=UPI000875C3DF|nr:helix-turn-helix domain-containing protein [Nonlabens sp. Hel1_33_55]SCY00667.1 transcriptional regulator, AlpA family [Nonlabens sp. Hel1_33_55]
MNDLELKDQLNRIEDALCNNKAVLTADEVSLFTGLSKKYIYTLTSKKQIPFYKPLGKVLYFSKKEVEEWMLTNGVKSSQQLASEATSYILNNKISK